MNDYIRTNKEAWEEAFELRDPRWGADVTERVKAADYGFFVADMAKVLRGIDCKGKTVAQFCCNNGRELLSLVKSADAARGVGFDIAENMIRFAKEKALELDLPCEFVATNILDIGDEYRAQFDLVIITIGALCWFRELDEYFAVVSRCMRPGARIIINEQHPCTNMLACEEDDGFDETDRLACIYSYFEHEWKGNDGMSYIAGRNYESKTFTDYTHPLSDIISAMCANGFVITGFKEYDYDISDMFPDICKMGFPLSMIIEGREAP